MTAECLRDDESPGPAGRAGGSRRPCRAAAGRRSGTSTGRDDPARGRSDHASFHERGWAAVAVSEDLFSTSDGAPGTGTRQYHTPGDTLLGQDHDTGFATVVAGSVIATALTFAGL
ncbi:M28 family peptidase [Streptomyces sp. MJP52]|uniref:M28 family peptidase n=1 Tax=Streptomyces sp. MJP52 TaxID=2940555 RepID=UPI0024747B37|nr:M28 family peptidase [Streptomyces sp. MJP52]MDH6229341.1 hypothetical protein [Streptomyces sp. MJP52]